VASRDRAPRVRILGPEHHPTKVVLWKMARKHTYRRLATIRNCLVALCDLVFLMGTVKGTGRGTWDASIMGEKIYGTC
jgi:hypothetical protein